MSSALIRSVTTWLSVPPLCNIFLRKLRQFTLGSTGLKAFLFLMQIVSEAARGEDNNPIFREINDGRSNDDGEVGGGFSACGDCFIFRYAH